MSVRDRDLPTSRARPRSLERDHIAIVAVRTAPNLELQIGEYDGFLMGDAEHVKIVERGQRSVVIDRVGNRGIVVARQQHHGQRRGRNDRSRSIEQINRHAMAIEGVAGQHHDVRAGRAGGAQDAGEPGGPIAPVQACGIVVIDVQVGAVNDHDVLGGGAGMGHGS
jgi:hypothetical protein